MKEKILKALKAGLPEGEKDITVALSGGADSMALLNLLLEVRNELGLCVYAAHLNHMIRGAEADRDEAFVRQECQRLGVKLFCERADVPSVAEREGKSLELAAREVRYEFLERVSMGLIATAHNADDNLETLLLNLTRGTGIEGLCGIPFKRGRLIRPLLSVSRAEIEEYCGKKGIGYVTDSTNLSDDYTRNKLRHRVIPALKEINPAVVETALRATENLKEISDDISKGAEEYIKKNTIEGGLSLEGFKELSVSVGKRIIKSFIEGKTGLALERVHIEAAYAKALKGGRTELMKGYYFAVVKNVGRIENSLDVTAYEVKISVIDAEELKKGNKINNLLLNNLLDCDKIMGQYCLRTRLPGDAVRLRGSGCTKTLNKLFNERAVPVHRRDKLPLLADDGGVIWVYGFGPANRCVADGNTKKIMIIDVEKGEV